MTTDDPRIRRERLHNQDVFTPSVEAWRDILRDGTLDGLPTSLPDWVSRWLDSYSDFDAAALGVVRHRTMGWVLVPLLRLAGQTYRVHYEDVICEHCGRRCGPSAAPDSVAYAGTGYSHDQVRAEFGALPVQSCPYCSGVLRRRQTVWLAAAERRTRRST